MNYQSSKNLHIETLLKNSIHRIKFELRDTTDEKIFVTTVEKPQEYYR